jgi:hypothetical protein
MKKCIALLAFLMFCFGSFASANTIGSERQDWLNKIAAKIDYYRIYLKPGYVFVAEKEIFLKIDEDILPLEVVYCDDYGVYIHDYQLDLIKCPICKRYYDPDERESYCPHHWQ